MSAPPARLRIPPGQDAVLRRMLAAPSEEMQGAVLERIEVGESLVQAHYSTPGGGATLVLRHPSQRSSRTLFEIGPFAIEARADDAGALAPLVASVREGIERHGAAFAWSRAEGMRADTSDVEQVALLAGRKPALRTVLAADEAALALRFYGEAGFVTDTRPADRLASRAGATIVYVARDPADLRALVAAEDASHVGRRRGESHRTMGRLLGFPACCVDAYLARWQRTEGWRSLFRLPDELYVASVAAAVPRPRARLNVVLAGLGPVLASFYPCRLDCEAALRTVDSFAEVLAADVRARIDASLARTVGVGSDGGRFLLSLSDESPRCIVAAEAVPTVRGIAPAARAVARSTELVGACAEGDVARIGKRFELRVLDFAWELPPTP